MTGETLKTVTPPLTEIRVAVWNHDSSKLLVGGSTGEERVGVIAVWDGKSLTDDRRLVEDRGRDIYSVSWNHDSSKIISSRLFTPIQIWNANSGMLLNSFIGHLHDIWSLFWNHDDSRIFSGSSDETVRIQDGTTGQLLKTGSFGGRVTKLRLTKEEYEIAFLVSGFIRCLPVTNL
jgi:WD40 repeat protein